MASLDASVWRRAASSCLSPYHPALISGDSAAIKQALVCTKQAHSNLSQGHNQFIGRLEKGLGTYLSPCASALAAVFVDRPPSVSRYEAQLYHQIEVYSIGAHLQLRCSISLRGLQRLQGVGELHTDTQLARSADSKEIAVVAEGLQGSALVCRIDANQGTITNAFSIPLRRPELPLAGSQPLKNPYCMLYANGTFILVQHQSHPSRRKVRHATGQLLMSTEDNFESWKVWLGESFLAYRLPGWQGVRVVDLGTKQPVFADRFVHHVFDTPWCGIDPRFIVSDDWNGPWHIMSLSMQSFGTMPTFGWGVAARSISPDMTMHKIICRRLEDSDSSITSHSSGESDSSSTANSSGERRRVEDEDGGVAFSLHVCSQDATSLFGYSVRLPSSATLTMSWSPDSRFAAIHQAISAFPAEPVPALAHALHMYMLDTATWQLRQLCHGIRGWIDQVDWSRDGSTIVIQAREASDVQLGGPTRCYMSDLRGFVVVHKLC